MDFKLKTIGSFISNDDIIYPFNLQSVDDLLLYRSKTVCQVLTFDNNENVTPTKLQLSNSQTTVSTEYPQLNVNKNKVYDSCDLNEKNYIMLNQYFLPDCTLKNVHYLKCEMSPFSERTGYSLACLTSSGMIELYDYNLDTSELVKIDVNFSALRKSTLKKPAKDIVKFDVLRTSFNEIAFANLEWCAVPFQDKKLLICVTKSDDIIFYQIQNNAVVELKSIKIEDAGRNKLKWMDWNDANYLLLSTDKGNLIMYSVDLKDDGTVHNIEKIITIEGKLKMPINYIAVDYHEDSTIILCCKGHTLEIFHMKDDKAVLVCSKYVDMTITGIKTCDNLEYLISTLNSRVYYVNLDMLNDEIVLKSCSKMDFDIFNDLEIVSNNNYYGIATSKNNVLVYLSCYPQHAFDHLVNKQPNHISINLFTKFDPMKMIINNKSRRLTDYGDCLEAIRFIGFENFESIIALEDMNYDIAMDWQFLYYLKVQLIVINIKLVYYQMKSRNIFNIITETKNSIRELILVINCYMLMNNILKFNHCTDIHFTVLKSLRKLITKYCNTVMIKEPFKQASEILTPQLRKILVDCDEKLKRKQFLPEICTFCEETIQDDQMECSTNHTLKRCITTNILMTSVNSQNYCRKCNESVTSLETLSSVAEESKEINILLCPLCDSKLVLNE